jgi:uncharacterized protein (UPF0261 family)
MTGAIYVVGTFDTKGRELSYLADRIATFGWQVVTVDVGTTFTGNGATIGAGQVAACHPAGADLVHGGDRGSAVAAMAVALQAFLASRDDIAGAIAMGGSGGTAIVAPALRDLPIGVPKVIVSTVASGNVAPYVDASDLVMMPSITDVAGLNRISRRVIANAAAAVTAMASANAAARDRMTIDRAAIGLTMFGVTTPCVDRIGRALEDRYDCLVFHATGTGGRTMEKLVDAGLIDGVIDATLTEIADLIAGGVMAASTDRLGAIARRGIPYVGSVGACDMVNFGARDTVPPHHAERLFYEHNPQVTLMRTTPEENHAVGTFIADKLNACAGEVLLLLPEGGVSAIDAPGMPFHDPVADAALFAAIEAGLIQTERRRLVRLPHHINDPAFADAMRDAFEEVFDVAA